MARQLTIAVVALVVAAAVLFAGCEGDNPGNGRVTAKRIADRIDKVCGKAEGSGDVGPRTITAIDLDGKDGPTGFLVTCVNGEASYVTAAK